MKPSEVRDEWVDEAAGFLCREIMGADPSGATRTQWRVCLDAARHALAAVLPLAVAEEREAIAQLCRQKADHHEKAVPEDYDEMSFGGQHEAESYGSMYTAHELWTAIRSRGEPR